MITISGGLIIKQNGTMVTYQPKCEKCETLFSEKHTVTLTKGVTEIFTFKCEKCGNPRVTKMKIVEVEKIMTP